jgi:hypothetical protein
MHSNTGISQRASRIARAISTRTDEETVEDGPESAGSLVRDSRVFDIVAVDIHVVGAMMRRFDGFNVAKS